MSGPDVSTTVTLRSLGPIISRTMAHLAERRNEWPDPDSNEMVDLVSDAMNRHIPKGRVLWSLFHDEPNMGNIDSPGAMAGTIEEVVRDAVKGQIEGPVFRWVDAVVAAEATQ